MKGPTPLTTFLAFLITAAVHAQAPAPVRSGPSGQISYDISQVEEWPVFPGGQEAMYDYFSKKTDYPIKAVVRGLEGKVYVEFTIDTIGNVTDVLLKRGVKDAEMLDEEAIRVVKAMPRWTPARLQGRPVACRFVIPVNFKLGKSKR